MAKRSVNLECGRWETCDSCGATSPRNWIEAREKLVGECPRARKTGRHRWRKIGVLATGGTRIVESFKCELCRVEVDDVACGSQRDPGEHDRVTTDED